MDTATASNAPAVEVSSWDACYNSADGIISLSCTVTAHGHGISGVGLLLNNSAGVTLASTYVELEGDCASVTPAINLPPGALQVGEHVTAVVSGQADGQHYFFEETLTIGNC